VVILCCLILVQLVMMHIQTGGCQHGNPLLFLVFYHVDLLSVIHDEHEHTSYIQFVFADMLYVFSNLSRNLNFIENMQMVAGWKL